MISSEMIDEVAKRLGLPRDVVAKPIIDMGRNSFSLLSSDLTPNVNINPFGVFYFKSLKSAKELEVKVAKLERIRARYDPYLRLGKTRNREIITKLIDLINAHFSQIIQNQVNNGQFKRGFNRKNEYDMEVLEAILQRFYTVINSLPCQLSRPEPSEVQKEALRKLFAKKVYIDIPLEIDCPVWPLRMYRKGKDSLFGLSLSAIFLERDRWIESCRKKGIESYLKTKHDVNISR